MAHCFASARRMAAGGLLTVVAVVGLLGTAGAFHAKTVAGVGTFYVVFSGCDRGSADEAYWVSNAPPDVWVYIRHTVSGSSGYSGLGQTDETGFATVSFRGGETFPVDLTAWADVDKDSQIPDPDDAQVGSTIHFAVCGDTGGQSDGAPPSISIVTPLPDVSFTLFQDVRANYSCREEPGGSGIAFCTGSVANGSPLDTAAAGLHTFTVTGKDNAGNTRVVNRKYTVADSGGGTPTPTASPTATATATATTMATTTATATVTPTSTACATARADGQPVGVTVNGAGRYTNNPNVDLGIVPPDAATGLLISNDGGFTRPFAAPLEPDRHYPWTLDSSGPERLPKTVYVRFAGACVDSSQTHQDDIILDETPPTLPTPTVRAPAKGRRGALSLSLKATDNASGVRRVEVRRARARIFAARYKRKIRLTGSPNKLTVRVRDGAGNNSPWKQAKVVRKGRAR